ncbi:hypothetical protein AB0F81_36340 [Actinoplanes sp. NPDC024001]|uniref:hypothetical protein n=1 Tax=Actinoplanes sp. NPDC024001 TaxID=3154598 RepID=UPI00340E8C9C
MLDPAEYDDVTVTVAHPFGDVDATLTEWIERGPGPRRLVEIVAARRRATGEPVDMSEIPLEFHNSPESRRLQRLGQLPAPWGPPPATEGYPPPID